MNKEEHRDRYKNKPKKTFWLTVGGLAGIVAIISLIITIAQLIQSSNEERTQNITQATSFAFQVNSQATDSAYSQQTINVLLNQVNVQETNSAILQQVLKLQFDQATIQANISSGTLTSEVADQQLESIQMTQTALSNEKIVLPTVVWAKIGVSDGDGALIRANPNYKAEIIQSLLNGALVAVLPEEVHEDGVTWVHVRLVNGKEGWIARGMLKTATPVPGW